MSEGKSREERLASAAAGSNRTRTDTGATSVRAETAKRTKSVRLSVDMQPPLHRRLDNWTGFARDELDVARVPAAVVVRILIERLTNVHGDDRELRERLVQVVLDDLRVALKE